MAELLYLRLHLLSQPFDLIDPVALDSLEEILQLGNLRVVPAGVGGVSDATDPSARLDPGNHPGAPLVHSHPKDLDARDDYFRRSPIGSRRDLTGRRCCK